VRPLALICSRAFTLIELIAVIAIIGMLVTLIAPQYGQMIDRANSVACSANLRQIGVAVNLYVNDNEQKFPYINNPRNPVYTDPAEIPEGVTPVTMAEAFGPYEISGKSLRCPSDVAWNNRFASEGTRYEWRPLLDGEEKVNPEIFTRRGTFRIVRLSRMRLVFDIDSVHKGRPNTLFADGSVRMVQ